MRTIDRLLLAAAVVAGMVCYAIAQDGTTIRRASGWLPSVSATFNPGTITANSCVDSSAITVTGAITGNACAVGESTNAAVTGVIQTCYVSAANAAKVRACCSAGASTCATGSQTYNVRVSIQ